jgi:hypothetical protein
VQQSCARNSCVDARLCFESDAWLPNQRDASVDNALRPSCDCRTRSCCTTGVSSDVHREPGAGSPEQTWIPTRQVCRCKFSTHTFAVSAPFADIRRRKDRTGFCLSRGLVVGGVQSALAGCLERLIKTRGIKNFASILNHLPMS